MEHRRLHPNLAKMAASYDDICEQFSRNQLTAEEARVRITSLVGRDDQGVQWCISPDDGNWYRVTVSGRLVRDEPPQAGVATYTGWDLSGGDPSSDPRYRVVDHKVDPRDLSDPSALGGSTARFVRNEADERRRTASPGRLWIVLVAVLVAVVVVSLWMATSAGAVDIVQVQPALSPLAISPLASPQ